LETIITDPRIKTLGKLRKAFLKGDPYDLGGVLENRNEKGKNGGST